MKKKTSLFVLKWTLVWIIPIMTLLIALILSFEGCAIKQITAKERAFYMMKVYNDQYADHRIQTGYILDSEGNWVKTSNPTLTIEQKKILQAKKDTLIKVRPLIQLYAMQAGSDITPDPEIEIEIMKLLNKLIQ